MDAKDFINEIFLRYPPEATQGLNFDKIRNDYITAIANEEEKYDYEATLKEIIANYEYKCTPAPLNLRQYLKKHVIYKIKQNYINFQSIFGDKGCRTYEFCIGTTEKQARINLEKMGFTNIRLD